MPSRRPCNCGSIRSRSHCADRAVADKAEAERRRVLCVPQDIHGWPAARVQALQHATAQSLAIPLAFHDPLRGGGKGPDMLVIPIGRFLMGSAPDEKGRYDDEGPQHAVMIARPFAIGRYAVRFKDYDRFCADTGRDVPSDQGWGRGKRPVVNISWDDASDYCLWLADRTGQGYRLPSESEWEYACRAGTTTAFHFGDTLSTDQANYNGNLVYDDGDEGVYRQQTLPVGSLPPNAFGLYEMHGNAWEWVQDCWHGDYTGAPKDGQEWRDSCPDSGRCVLRGGAWCSDPGNLRSASRLMLDAGNRDPHLGFRVARTLSP